MDLALGLIFLDRLQAWSHPIFGPPAWLKTWAAVYEALHLPLGFLIPKVQEQVGYLGTFAQAWRTPEAQVVRLFLFVLNSALLCMGGHFLLAKKVVKAPTFQLRLAARLRQLLSEDKPWSPILDSPLDRGQWAERLAQLERQIQPMNVNGTKLQEARVGALAFLDMEDQGARLWLALGQATLLIAEAGLETPDAAGAALGHACLRRARALEPKNPETWRALLQWRLLPFQALADAPQSVLQGLGPVGAIWALTQDPLLQGENLPEAVVQWGSRWPHAAESLRLRAEALESLGRYAEALELWRTLLTAAPTDWRWRRRALALLASQGLPEAEGRLPAAGPPLILAPDWLYQASLPAPRISRLQRTGRILVGMALLALLVCPFKLLSKPHLDRDAWPGDWVCQALVSPAGDPIPTSSSHYRSYLPEAAAGFTAITAIARAPRLDLQEGGAGTLSLDRSYPVTWDWSPWGMDLRVEAYAEAGIFVLREREHGLELSIPGQSWTLYFMREDYLSSRHCGECMSDLWGNLHPELDGYKMSADDDFSWYRNRWGQLSKNGPEMGPLPPVYETLSGAFLDLNERGWVKVGSTEQGLKVYESVTGNIPLPAAPETHEVAASVESSDTPQETHRPPASESSACRCCVRVTTCPRGEEMPVARVEWMYWGWD